MTKQTIDSHEPKVHITHHTAKEILSAEDAKILVDIADTSGDGKVSDEELDKLILDYNEKKIVDEKVLAILRKYDQNQDGIIDLEERRVLQHHLSLQETAARYVGYSIGFARAFRYLAFTSDLGEALRPVVSVRLVNASYAVALGYCVADVGWEAYNLRKRGYLTENDEPMTIMQCIVCHDQRE
jgi:hypothetical protein